LPSLSSLLLKIPDEFKPLAAIGIGSLILVVLLLFHGIGLHLIIVPFKRAEVRLRAGRPHLGRAGLLFGWAVYQMLFLHILEIAFWAFALNRLGLIIRPTDALYFCANAYTTLGYGAVDLGTPWRNISPIIAISGLFTFAWTASSLVNMVGAYIKLVEQLEYERLEELDLRATARTAERDVARKERAAEAAEELEARKRAGSASFFERRKIRREEKQEEKQMRAAAKAEVKNIREKERADEDALGQTAPQDDSEARK
jgi:hypothetical protein